MTADESEAEFLSFILARCSGYEVPPLEYRRGNPLYVILTALWHRLRILEEHVAGTGVETPR